MTDKTSLAYWFPLLQAAGLPVPKTTILEMSRGAAEALWSVHDGVSLKRGESAAFDNFVADITRAAVDFGFPCFLRTGYASAKHSWSETCFLPDADSVHAHILAIVEFSEMADMIGLPYGTWAIRELLPTKPLGICTAYRGMPVCREFRLFVDGPEVICRHPYWPRRALAEGGAPASVYEEACHLTVAEDSEIRDIASRAGAALGGGAWSIDILDTKGGWYVTDLAEAHKSFHWEGCRKAYRFEKAGGTG